MKLQLLFFIFFVMNAPVFAETHLDNKSETEYMKLHSSIQELNDRLQKLEDCTNTNFFNYWFCDWSNFHTLIVEISIGGGLAIAFFLWQWDIRRKRREHGQASFVTALWFLKEKIEKQKITVTDHYDGKLTMENVEKEHDFIKNTTGYLRFAVGFSHDTMDTSIIKGVELICTYAEMVPITGKKDLDLDHCDQILEDIEKMFNTYLKKAKKYFDEERNKVRNKALKDLTKKEK